MEIPGDSKDGSVFDRGLQHERTALAWDRTGVAIMVSGLLFIRAVRVSGLDWLLLPGLLFMTLGAAVLWNGYRRYGRRSRGPDPRIPVTSPGLTRVVGWASVLFGLASAAVVLY